MSNIVLKGQPNYFLHKGQLGIGNKNQSWQDVTWDWVLKRKFLSVDDPRAGAISLQPIKVYVWDEHGKGSNPAFTQEFTADKNGTKAAHKYARYVVEEHGALLSSVETRINLPDKYDAPVEFTSYELVEK
jgi:hypothetical protein